MPLSDTRLAKTIHLVAAGTAITVAVSMPLGYWLLAYNFEAEETSNDATARAELVTQRINAAPDLWQFEIPRLDAIITARSVTNDLPEQHDILNERGAVLAQSAQSLSAPVLTRSAPLLDSGRVVGRCVTSRSLLPLLQDTALVALFALALALAIYLSLNVLPLRALRRMGVALDTEQAALRAREEHFRAIFDRAIDGIMIMSPVGKLVAVNESFRRKGARIALQNNNSSGNPLANLIVAAISAALTRAAPNYLPLTQQANKMVFVLGPNAIPNGPYSKAVQ